MPSAVDNLLNILNLEELELNLFRGQSPKVGWQRVFGGQVIGQALVAARRTVEDRQPHSLHGYFLLAGDPERGRTVPVAGEQFGHRVEELFLGPARRGRCRSDRAEPHREVPQRERGQHTDLNRRPHDRRPEQQFGGARPVA